MLGDSCSVCPSAKNGGPAGRAGHGCAVMTSSRDARACLERAANPLHRRCIDLELGRRLANAQAARQGLAESLSPPLIPVLFGLALHRRMLWVLALDPVARASTLFSRAPYSCRREVCTGRSPRPSPDYWLQNDGARLPHQVSANTAPSIPGGSKPWVRARREPCNR